MDTYTIEWLEKKEYKPGKFLYKVSLKPATGDMINNVTIWDSFPGFTDIMPGSTISGELETKEHNGYVNTTLKAPRSANSERSANRKTEIVTQAMERKEQSITRFQATKEESIKMAGAARDATLIVTTFYPEFSLAPNKDALIKEQWNQWRSWLLGASDQPF